MHASHRTNEDSSDGPLSNELKDDESVFIEDVDEKDIDMLDEEDPDARVQENMTRLFKTIGGCGLFQIYAYISIVCGISSLSFLIYGIPSLIKYPSECYVDNDPSNDFNPAACNCGTSPDVDYSIEGNFYNWVPRLDLYCVKETTASLLGSANAWGLGVSVLWLSSFADRFGRKNIFYIVTLIDAGVYTAIFFTRSFWVMFAWITILGFNSAVRVNVGIVYLLEMMPTGQQTFVTAFWNVGEAIINIAITVYFFKMNGHWQWLLLVGFGMNIVALVFLIWLPESPRFLVNSGRLDEAKKAFEVIAWWNKTSFKWEEHLYTKSGKARKHNPLLCSQGSETNSGGMMELLNFPPDVTEQIVRAFLRKRIGDALYQRISTVAVMSDMERKHMLEESAHKSGDRVSGSIVDQSSSASSAVAFVYFTSEAAMAEAIEELKGAKLRSR